MRIAITGASGFIGTCLVKHLIEAHDLVVLGRTHAKLEATFADDPVETKETNHEQQELQNLFEDVNAVVHLAARRPQSGDKMLTPEPVQVNPRLTGNVLRAAGQAGVDIVCRTSTILVYPREDGPFTEDDADPFNAYGVSKYAGDQLGEIADGVFPEMNVVSLRLGSVYGRGGRGMLMDFVKQAKKGETLTIHGQGESVRDFIHVNDVTRAIEQSLSADGSGIFNIGAGGDTIADVAETIAREIEEEVRVRYDRSVTEDAIAHIMDCSLADRELDWTMNTPLQNGIRTLIARI